jgi:hypothetical protein
MLIVLAVSSVLISHIFNILFYLFFKDCQWVLFLLYLRNVRTHLIDMVLNMGTSLFFSPFNISSNPILIPQVWLHRTPSLIKVVIKLLQLISKAVFQLTVNAIISIP